MASNKGRLEKPPQDEVESGDENPERGNWTGKLDFLLSCLGYAVGLGNVWRFPYLCFKHGGGAFLIPYAIMLFCIGLPCFLLELTIGQYSSLGPVTVYSNLSPLFKGLGFANFMASCFVGLYYNMIIAWTIYYLFASFTAKLPWDNCQNDFNTDFCFNINEYADCTKLRENSTNLDVIYHKHTCIQTPEGLQEIRDNVTYFYGCTYKPNKTEEKDLWEPGIYVNMTTCLKLTDENVADVKAELFDIPFKARITAAQEYLDKEVLKKSKGINPDQMGPVDWKLALCLLAAWIVIFGCLVKGIKSSGRVVYFTATFPYLILVILLIRATLLPGAYDGIKFYMVPDWDRLSDIKVWEAAAVQIFFSLSVAGGGLITLASYNRFHNNVIRDTLIVCFGNCFTSVFAGFAIFSILGFLAKELGVPVKDVVQGGSGLAFVAYPDLVTRMTGGPFWAVLFFAMLFTLGLDSQFAIVETVLTGVLDFAPKLRPYKTPVVGALCSIGFIIGLPLTTGGGSYLLDLLDYYAAGWPYLFIGLVELIIISYVYGINNYLADLKHIVGFDPANWLRYPFVFMYSVLSPLLILVILISSWATHESLESGGYLYPDWANAVGWIIAMTAILAVPLVAKAQIIWKVFMVHSSETWPDRLSLTMDELLKPTNEWRKTADRMKRREMEKSGVVNVGMSPISDEK